MHVGVWVGDTWMCGESWLATKDLLPTIPVLKAGHPGVPSYMYIHVCLFVRDMVGWFILLSFLSYFFKLVCYAHVFPCI